MKKQYGEWKDAFPELSLEEQDTEDVEMTVEILGRASPPELDGQPTN